MSIVRVSVCAYIYWFFSSSFDWWINFWFVHTWILQCSSIPAKWLFSPWFSQNDYHYWYFSNKKKSIPLNEVDSSILQCSSIPLQEIPWLFPIIYMSQATTTLVLHWITRSPSLYNSYNQKATFVTNWIKKIRKSFLRSRIFFKLSLKNDVGFILRRRNRFETCKIL